MSRIKNIEETEDKTFEQAISELENIVKALEQGQVSLDEALQKFEAGIRLSRYCNNKLNEAEKKINLLLKEESGIVIKPADLLEDIDGD